MSVSVYICLIFSHQQTTPARTGQDSGRVQVAGYNDLVVVQDVQRPFLLIGLLQRLELLFAQAMERLMDNLFWIYK